MRPVSSADTPSRSFRGFKSSIKSTSYCLSVDPSQEATEGSEVVAQPQGESENAVVAHDDHRVRILFERCLIACALYEEFWTRVRTAFERGIHI